MWLMYKDISFYAPKFESEMQYRLSDFVILIIRDYSSCVDIIFRIFGDIKNVTTFWIWVMYSLLGLFLLRGSYYMLMIFVYIYKNKL